METTKKILWLALLMISFSCQVEDNVDVSRESKNFEILAFNNTDQISLKINEILEIQRTLNAEISNKLFERNNISSISESPVGDSKQLTWDFMKDDVVFYHQEKLNSIYELREILEFTSIQSIADEVNSLKGIGQTIKASQLLNKYWNNLEQTEYGVFPKIDKESAMVANKNGDIQIDNNIHNLTPINDARSTIVCLTEGVLANSGSTYFITYHAGTELRSNNIFRREDHKIFTQFGSFVNSPNGLIPFPSIYNPHPNSKVDFSFGFNTFAQYFPGDEVSLQEVFIQESTLKASRFCPVSGTGSIPTSNFATIVNGQVFITSGSANF